MAALDSLPTPALVLDVERLEANLRRMASRARRLGVALRPHVKTHKSPEIARLQVAEGARGITVSTLDEAAAFIEHGFEDLTWAFPVVESRIDQARELAGRATLRLVIDGEAALAALEGTGFPFHVWLKVDCGYHRAGVDPDGPLAVPLAQRLQGSPTLRFDGLLSHSGQAYRASGRRELAAVAEDERGVMAGLAGRLRDLGIAVPAVSVGSTPAMSAAESLEGVDEARPGNYAFYDYTQVALGACPASDCALTVVATVISSQPGAAHAVVDAGALALSRDPGPSHAGAATMGEVFEDYPAGRLSPTTRVASLTQEHGILTAPLPCGSRVRILPNHSCLAAACFDRYWVVRGDQVLDRWKIFRGRS